MGPARLKSDFSKNDFLSCAMPKAGCGKGSFALMRGDKPE
jgi:hypothetical protein